MTEQSRHWDGTSLGDATMAPYSASEWADQQKLEQGLGVLYPNYGVLQGTGDGTNAPLTLLAKSPASTNVELEIGAALVRGYLYENTAALTLAVSANASGNPRIDTVVIRADLIAQTVRAVVKQGSPAVTPARVAMQQDATIWEIPVADIAVANGFATLPQTTITQRQRLVGIQGMGWQAFAYADNYAYGTSVANNRILSSAMTVLIPVTLSAPMLLQDVSYQVQATGLNYQWGWDLYLQDTNDGQTAENTLRRVAQSNGDKSGNYGVGTTTDTLAVLGGIVPLAPGQYWLAFQNRHAVNNLVISAQQPNTFDGAFYSIRSKTTTNPNGATLDVVTGWATGNQQIYCILLRGRVFGMSTVLIP